MLLSHRPSVLNRLEFMERQGNMLRCGIDMIECQRIADGIDRLGERFLRRFFTTGEREDCEEMPYRLAARLFRASS